MNNLIGIISKLIKSYKYSLMSSGIKALVILHKKGLIDLNNEEFSKMMCNYYAKQYSRD